MNVRAAISQIRQATDSKLGDQLLAGSQQFRGAPHTYPVRLRSCPFGPHSCTDRLEDRLRSGERLPRRTTLATSTLDLAEDEERPAQLQRYWQTVVLNDGQLRRGLGSIEVAACRVEQGAAPSG